MLAIENDEIWEAEPVLFDSSWGIYGKGRYGSDAPYWLRVRLTAVFRSAQCKVGDTVRVDVGHSYYWPGNPLGYMGGSLLSPRDTVCRMLLFCQSFRGESLAEQQELLPQPVSAPMARLYMSGVRLLDRRQQVYWPFQHSDQSAYAFYRDEKARWPELSAAAQHQIRRVDSLFSIRAISDPVEQNRALFAWIKGHLAELTDPKGEGYWQWYKGLPFAWALCNGIAEQAWEALVWHHRLFPEELLSYGGWAGSVVGELPKPFQGSHNMAFLWGKIKSPSLEPKLRMAAMYQFRTAC